MVFVAVFSMYSEKLRFSVLRRVVRTSRQLYKIVLTGYAVFHDMRDGKKIGITAGAFDLCHAGHILMFKEARSVCDHLIVALHEDPSVESAEYRGKKKNKPIMSVEERTIILEAIRYIDEVIPYKTETDLYNLLVELKPDVRIIGEDWDGKMYTGHDLPIEMFFNTRGHHFSTTELRERIAEAEAGR